MAGLLAFGLAVCLSGCAGGDPLVDEEDGGAGGSTESVACNQIALGAGPVVQVIEVDEDPPAPTGGAFAPGALVTSHLTASTRYTGVGGTSGPTEETRQEVNDCDDTTCTTVIATTPTLEEQRFSWDISFAGTDMTFTESCGNGVPSFTVPYSVDGTTFLLHQGDTIFTYTRQ